MPCDEKLHEHDIHLILTQGAVNCELSRVLPKDCNPEKSNLNVTAPASGLFSNLLFNSSLRAAESVKDFIQSMVRFSKSVSKKATRIVT